MKYYNIIITIIVIFFVYKIIQFYDFNISDIQRNLEEYYNYEEVYLEEKIAKQKFSNLPPISITSETYLKLYKNEILNVSKKWGVPISAIAGIIASESTLNFDGAHRLENYYFKNFILNKTEQEITEMITEANVANLYNSKQAFFKKIHKPATWSIGLCQMHLDIAIEIEPIKAKKERRAIKTNKELIGELLNPRSNIDYCAFYMRSIRDKYYKELDVDLYKRPSLLVTIYNIGKVDKLIKQRKSIRNLDVSMLENNWFGAFTELHEYKLDSIIQYSVKVSSRSSSI